MTDCTGCFRAWQARRPRSLLNPRPWIPSRASGPPAHCACHRGREYFRGFRHFPPVNYRRKDFKVSKPSETFFNTGFRVLGGPRDSFETAESFEFTISDSFASIRASCALRLPSRGGSTSEVFAIELEGRRNPQNASILQPWQLWQKR